MVQFRNHPYRCSDLKVCTTIELTLFLCLLESVKSVTRALLTLVTPVPKNLLFQPCFNNQKIISKFETKFLNSKSNLSI